MDYDHIDKVMKILGIVKQQEAESRNAIQISRGTATNGAATSSAATSSAATNGAASRGAATGNGLVGCLK